MSDKNGGPAFPVYFPTDTKDDAMGMRCSELAFMLPNIPTPASEVKYLSPEEIEQVAHTIRPPQPRRRIPLSHPPRSEFVVKTAWKMSVGRS